MDPPSSQYEFEISGQGNYPPNNQGGPGESIDIEIHEHIDPSNVDINQTGELDYGSQDQPGFEIRSSEQEPERNGRRWQRDGRRDSSATPSRSRGSTRPGSRLGMLPGDFTPPISRDGSQQPPFPQGLDALDGQQSNASLMPPSILELAGIGRHGSLYYRAPAPRRMSATTQNPQDIQQSLNESDEDRNGDSMYQPGMASDTDAGDPYREPINPDPNDFTDAGDPYRDPINPDPNDFGDQSAVNDLPMDGYPAPGFIGQDASEPEPILNRIPQSQSPNPQAQRDQYSRPIPQSLQAGPQSHLPGSQNPQDQRQFGVPQRKPLPPQSQPPHLAGTQHPASNHPGISQRAQANQAHPLRSSGMHNPQENAHPQMHQSNNAHPQMHHNNSANPQMHQNNNANPQMYHNNNANPQMHHINNAHPQMHQNDRPGSASQPGMRHQASPQHPSPGHTSSASHPPPMGQQHASNLGPSHQSRAPSAPGSNPQHPMHPPVQKPNMHGQLAPQSHPPTNMSHQGKVAPQSAHRNQPQSKGSGSVPHVPHMGQQRASQTNPSHAPQMSQQNVPKPIPSHNSKAPSASLPNSNQSMHHPVQQSNTRDHQPMNASHQSGANLGSAHENHPPSKGLPSQSHSAPVNQHRASQNNPTRAPQGSQQHASKSEPPHASKASSNPMSHDSRTRGEPASRNKLPSNGSHQSGSSAQSSQRQPRPSQGQGTTSANSHSQAAESRKTQMEKEGSELGKQIRQQNQKSNGLSSKPKPKPKSKRNSPPPPPPPAKPLTAEEIIERLSRGEDLPPSVTNGNQVSQPLMEVMVASMLAAGHATLMPDDFRTSCGPTGLEGELKKMLGMSRMFIGGKTAAAAL